MSLPSAWARLRTAVGVAETTGGGSWTLPTSNGAVAATGKCSPEKFIVENLRFEKGEERRPEFAASGRMADAYCTDAFAPQHADASMVAVPRPWDHVPNSWGV